MYFKEVRFYLVMFMAILPVLPACSEPAHFLAKAELGKLVQIPNSHPVGDSGNVVGRTISSPPSGNHITDNVPQWQWISLPGTKVADTLGPESFTAPVTYPGSEKKSAESIFGAWSGGALVETEVGTKIYFLHNGGHADYCGNQNLMCDIENLSCTQLKGPTTDFTGFDTSNKYHSMPSDSILEDENGIPIVGETGSPVSAHTYGGTIYNRANNELFTVGGSDCGGAGRVSDVRWAVSLDGLTNTYQGGYNPNSWILGWQLVEDAVNDRILGVRNTLLYELQDDYSWKKIAPGAYGNSGAIHSGIAMDSAGQKILVVGQSSNTAKSPTAHEIDAVTGVRTGITALLPTELTGCVGPGLEFVPEFDKYIGWCGGPVYLIDPTDYSYTSQATTGPVPPKNLRGVYGRFAYSSKYGGIVYPYSIDEDIAYLKLLPPQ